MGKIFKYPGYDHGYQWTICYVLLSIIAIALLIAFFIYIKSLWKKWIIKRKNHISSNDQIELKEASSSML